MAGTAENRYALFVEEDENESPMSSPVVDLSRNPFINQVADDSIPWQEVKKRGAPTTQPSPASRGKVLGVRDQNQFVHAQHGTVNRARATSGSTAEATDKIFDPHENWCGVCSLKLPNKAALLNHIKLSPEHKHYCNLCKRVFKDRNGLKNHLENSLGHEVHCNLCLSAFNNEWGLKNHFENNYAVGHEFICITCLLGFRTRVELERHLQSAAKHTWCAVRMMSAWTQRSLNLYTTPGCDFDCSDSAALDEHLRRDHFQCVGCKRILPSQTKLNQHLESCTFAITCSRCNATCAGQAQLAIHHEHCFSCEECGFWTHHEGNYQIHMTKHAFATIPCWGCDAPMRTYSSLVNHLESGRCPNFQDQSVLTLCLGKWWYSPLYMDLDLHAQIRTGRIDLFLMQQWMDASALFPFICRDEKCQKTFAHMSSLVLHCESQACGWDIARLNMPGLEKEIKKMCVRRDSATA
ncbi:hypothetical protein BDU57DRAFT_570051 [Ampelomyces quisqualis]|uniref:C2H2-type domain-containing protein n=1 Tax=Ampelomyces quisqualis TaxID=50730 RepID=A0A6A5QWW2_AMPQU|nr:hypothetical protein BDU57DRAFT_570051 [Ampelomyces quisqualis]